MKKIYEKPVMDTVTMNLESMIAESLGISQNSFSGNSAEIQSNERRGIFSNEDESGYDRTLW